MDDFQTYTLFIFEIDSLSHEDISSLHDQFNSTNISHSFDYEFQKLMLSRSSLSGTLIKRTITSLKYFDIEEKIFSNRTIEIFSEVEFDIDTLNNLLIIYGSSVDIPKFKGVFKRILTKGKSLTPLNISPYVIYNKIKLTSIFFKIYKMSIQAYKHTEGAIGMFKPDISKNQIAKNLFEEYKHDVTKCLIYFTYDNFEFYTNFSKTGNLQIRCHEDDFLEIQKILIKTLII
ncbi:hypothetical protein KI659_16690 [Litoribacter alkaliphilus]|uniref:Uncharacterized protein n=1 Tax=Litoribacter ruber TaxID=702568 RepID=A0AAP2CJ19_9BACT|nr:hypothetical protein [Litoribacter alkaliphilus]MBS9525658.1 hypothetical protein [Litoribacter alkaliphilus]